MEDQNREENSTKGRAVRGEWKSSAMGEEKVRRMWERAYLCSIHRGLRIHRIRLLVECVYLYSYMECMWARVGAERLPIPGVTPCEWGRCGGGPSDVA